MHEQIGKPHVSQLVVGIQNDRRGKRERSAVRVYIGDKAIVVGRTPKSQGPKKNQVRHNNGKVSLL